MASPKRTVLITGCSDGGLGSALAIAFHKTGNWRVFASARNPSKLTALAPFGIETVPLDVLSPSSIASAVAYISSLTTNPSLDCLLHNAGAGFTMPLMDIDPALLSEAKSLFDLNIWSLLTVTQAFLPLLRNAAPGALLVVNTSLSSQTAGMAPFAGVYNASKAAAAAITETLRIELAVFGIRTINLVTGAVKTNFGPNRAVEATLSAGSIYGLAREEAQKVMDNTVVEEGSDATEWAGQVVRELSGGRPGFWIWKGKLAVVRCLNRT